MSHNNFGADGSILTKLFPVDVPQGSGDNVGTIFGRPPPKIWEDEKTSKIWRDFRQLSTLIAIIFGTHRQVESQKNRPSSTTTPSTLDQKNLVNFGLQTTHIDQPKWTFFVRLHFGH